MPMPATAMPVEMAISICSVRTSPARVIRLALSGEWRRASLGDRRGRRGASPAATV